VFAIYAISSNNQSIILQAVNNTEPAVL